MTRLMMIALAAMLAAPTQGDPVPAIGERVWAKPDHFWWRKNLPGGGNVWLTVDAKHGAKSPLFDHQRLAIELNLRSGYEFTPLTLPFADPASHFVVKYDGSNAYIQEGAMAIEFVLDGYQWRCELQTKWDWNKVPPTDYECLPRRPAAAWNPSPPVKATSPDGKWEAFVQNNNVAVRAVDGGLTKVLTTDGANGDAYDPGSLRWADDSRSLSAYRLNAAIWESDGVSGNVRQHITYRTLTIPKKPVPVTDRSGR
jgi:hypothetical protein